MAQRERLEVIEVDDGRYLSRIPVHISEPADLKPKEVTDPRAITPSTRPLELASPRNARARTAYTEYLKGFYTAKRK